MCGEGKRCCLGRCNGSVVFVAAGERVSAAFLVNNHRGQIMSTGLGSSLFMSTLRGVTVCRAMSLRLICSVGCGVRRVHYRAL